MIPPPSSLMLESRWLNEELFLEYNLYKITRRLSNKFSFMPLCKNHFVFSLQYKNMCISSGRLHQHRYKPEQKVKMAPAFRKHYWSCNRKAKPYILLILGIGITMPVSIHGPHGVQNWNHLVLSRPI
jgi:hypothetical protein